MTQWWAEGAQILTFFSCEGAEPFFQKRFLPQKEAFHKLRGSPGTRLRGNPKITMHERRAPSQPSNFPGPFAAHETRLPAERAIGGSFLRHFRKALREKRGLLPGSFAALRGRRKKDISPKSPRLRRKNTFQTNFSCCDAQRKVGSAGRTDFRNFSKTWKENPKVSHMVKSRKPWKN